MPDWNLLISFRCEYLIPTSHDYFVFLKPIKTAKSRITFFYINKYDKNDEEKYRRKRTKSHRYSLWRQIRSCIHPILTQQNSFRLIFDHLPKTRNHLCLKKILHSTLQQNSFVRTVKRSLERQTNKKNTKKTDTFHSKMIENITDEINKCNLQFPSFLPLQNPQQLHPTFQATRTTRHHSLLTTRPLPTTTFNTHNRAPWRGPQSRRPPP